MSWFRRSYTRVPKARRTNKGVVEDVPSTPTYVADDAGPRKVLAGGAAASGYEVRVCAGSVGPPRLVVSFASTGGYEVVLA